MLTIGECELVINDITVKISKASRETDKDKRREIVQEIKSSEGYKELMITGKVFMDDLVKYAEHVFKSSKEYENHLRVTSYKKSKSQRKNWGKWKKRK